MAQRGAIAKSPEYALDQTNGKLLWQNDYKTGFIASPAVQRGLVVIGDVEGSVYAIDSRTGQRRWQVTTDGELDSSLRGHLRLGYLVREAREISLSAGYSSAGLTNFASGEWDYRYFALILGVAWVL